MDCHATVPKGMSGYCLCATGPPERKAASSTCDHPGLTCEVECRLMVEARARARARLDEQKKTELARLAAEATADASGEEAVVRSARCELKTANVCTAERSMSTLVQC